MSELVREIERFRRNHDDIDDDREQELDLKLTIELLVNRGYDVNYADHEGMTPLMWSCKKIIFTVAKCLIEKGADIHATNNEGKTALHIAYHPAIVRLLLEKGADIEARDLEGNTPFLIASFNERLSVVEVLLEHGANVDAINNEGQTVFSQHIERRNLSYRRPWKEILNVLIDEAKNKAVPRHAKYKELYAKYKVTDVKNQCRTTEDVIMYTDLTEEGRNPFRLEQDDMDQEKTAFMEKRDCVDLSTIQHPEMNLEQNPMNRHVYTEEYKQFLHDLRSRHPVTGGRKKSRKGKKSRKRRSRRRK